MNVEIWLNRLISLRQSIILELVAHLHLEYISRGEQGVFWGLGFFRPTVLGNMMPEEAISQFNVGQNYYQSISTYAVLES